MSKSIYSLTGRDFLMSKKTVKKTTKSSRRKLDLSFTVCNIGPVDSAQIDLKPLTVFIGPNNSGKSFTAMAIHSVLGALQGKSMTGGILSFSQGYPHLSDLGFRPKAMKKWLSVVGEEKKSVAPSSVIREIIRAAEMFMGSIIEDQLVRTYATDVKNIIRFGENELELSFKNSDLEINYNHEKKSIVNLECTIPDIHLHSKLFGTKKKRKFKVTLRLKDSSSFGFEGMIPISRINVLSSILVDQAAKTLLEEIIGKNVPQCKYLPAARSGILQGYKALTSSLYKMTPYAGITEIQVPTYPGTIADLIQDLLWYSERKRKSEKLLNKLAAYLESEILKGQVIIDVPDSRLPAYLGFRQKGVSIDLHLVSSAISEIIPLFVFLKNVIRIGDSVVIEEPEAHLDPMNQRTIAKFLVNLVNIGVNVIVTTHSDFLIEALNNSIRRGSIESKKKGIIDIDDNPTIVPEMVAAYFFRMEEGITKVEKMVLTEGEGIPENQFADVRLSLYEDAIDIDKQMKLKLKRK